MITFSLLLCVTEYWDDLLLVLLDPPDAVFLLSLVPLPMYSF
jgi:hypothetical protein